VRIRCEPQIQHGEKREWFRASADGTGFVKCDEVPLIRFSELAFDVPLGRNEFLVIGWSADQRDTVGSVLFGADANGQPRQRVLVVRARQGTQANRSELPALDTAGRRPTVAAEAGKPR
jgi:hypothetical protein